MDLTFIIVIFALGFIGSFLSGMLGVGGSIIKYPMLLYIPPLFGLAAFTSHEVSGISAVQVLFASIAGVWAYRKGGYLNKDLILYMGGSILVGSFIGSYGSGFLSEEGVNIVYGISIIRVSGPDAFIVGDKIFSGVDQGQYLPHRQGKTH